MDENNQGNLAEQALKARQTQQQQLNQGSSRSNNRELETGQELVKLSDLIEYEARITEETKVVFAGHARKLVVKGRLNQREQDWMPDYCSTLPLVVSGDRSPLDDVSETPAMSHTSNPMQMSAPLPLVETQSLPELS